MINMDPFINIYTGQDMRVLILVGNTMDSHIINEDSTLIDCIKEIAPNACCNIVHGNQSQFVVSKSYETEIEEYDIICLLNGYSLSDNMLPRPFALLVSKNSYNGCVVDVKSHLLCNNQNCLSLVQPSTNRTTEVSVSSKYVEKYLSNKNVSYQIEDLSCIIVAAYFALLLEAHPFYKPLNLFHALVKHENSISLSSEKKPDMNLQNRRRIAVIVSRNSSKYLDYPELVLDDVEAYYDNQIKEFMAIKDNNFHAHKEDVIVYVNPSSYSIRSENLPVFAMTRKEYYGLFDNILFPAIGSFFHASSPRIIKQIETPIISIVGFGMESKKIDVSLEMLSRIMRRGLLPGLITSNPIGYLYKNTHVFPYPEHDRYTDIVYSINHKIHSLCLKEEPDLLITDIGGGIMPLNDKIDNDF